MKSKSKNLNVGILLLFLGCISIFMFSCAKDVGSKAAPIITRIRMPEAQKADSVVLKSRPGASIVIEGKNLSNAKQVLFNGLSAYFNVAFNTDTHIWVDIPTNTPTLDRFPDVDNTIKVVTPNGVATYAFPVEPPPPTVLSIVNENPKPGTTMVFKGNYFFSVHEVKFPNGVISKEVTINDAGTELTVKVPQDLGATAGRVVLLSVFGNDTTDVIINKIDGIGIASNFDNNTFYLNIANASEITDNGTLFPDGRGKYYRSNQAAIAPYNKVWWDPGRSVRLERQDNPPAPANTKVVLDASAIAAINNPDTLKNFALKFELNTRTDWDKNLFYRINFNKTHSYTLQPWLSAENGDTGTSYLNGNTGNKWVTFTIPLSKFRGAFTNEDNFPPDASKPVVAKLSELFDANGAFKQLYFRGKTDRNPTEPMDYAIDNIRIVRLKN